MQSPINTKMFERFLNFMIEISILKIVKKSITNETLVEMPQQCTLMARVAASAVQRIGIPLFLVSFKIPNKRKLENNH